MLASKSTTSQVVSDFTTTNSNTGCGSLVVEFEDLSTGNPNSWLWDFGNGITSTQQNPVVVYANEGFYSVSLSISDAVTSGVMENRVYMYHVYVTDYNEKVWVYNGELNLMK
ncbi:MAG: PKD domain-containing protein [Flavobacteriales bacterium]|nr:PKD domain-containing protein [Flavobacteriales bacterium]